MQVTASAAVKVNECSLNATCHELLWGIIYSAYSVVGLLMIYCTFSVHTELLNTLLRRYKYLIMSVLQVKDKCLKFKPSAFFSFLLVAEKLESCYSHTDCFYITG